MPDQVEAFWCYAAVATGVIQYYASRIDPAYNVDVCKETIAKIHAYLVNQEDGSDIEVG